MGIELLPMGASFCAVVIPRTPLSCLTYRFHPEVTGELAPGDIVRVPLRKRQTLGVVWEIQKGCPDIDRAEVKDIAGVVKRMVVPSELLQLVRWVADYYCAALGEVMGFVLPRGLSKELLAGKEEGMEVAPVAASASVRLRASPLWQGKLPPELIQAIEEKRFGVWGDFGGAGEIPDSVIEFIQRATDSATAGASAIVMMPEARIATCLPFLRDAFGDVVIEYHHRLTPSEVRRVWRLIKQSEKSVVVGVRSVVWAPVENLRGIVVLEEHSPGFKEERKPRFNARDVAIARAKFASCPVLLSDLTPTLETWHNGKRGKFQLVGVSQAAGERSRFQPMRENVFVVDMRLHRDEVLSPRLLTELKRARERGKVALCYINRKGVSRFVVCRTCGTVLRCPDCDVAGVLMGDGTVICRYCGLTKPAPDFCPNCQGVDFQFRAPGVDMVKRKLKECGLWDEGNKVIVGTKKVLAAPFPEDLGVVGIINFDTEFALPDFRAREEAFRLLRDVLFRARTRRARVVIQTYRPDDVVINSALEGDVAGFLDSELKVRKETGFPPYRRLVLLTLSGKGLERVKEVIDGVRKALSKVDNVEILGPLLLRKRQATAAIIIKLPTNIMPGKVLMPVLTEVGGGKRGDVRVKIDVDPREVI